MFVGLGMMANYELQAPIFAREEYSYWQVKMRHFLIAKGLWDCIIAEYEELEDWSSLVYEERRERKEEQHQNCISLLEIRKSMELNTFSLIISCRTAASAWKRLQDVFGTEFDNCVIKGILMKISPLLKIFMSTFMCKILGRFMNNLVSFMLKEAMSMKEKESMLFQALLMM